MVSEMAAVEMPSTKWIGIVSETARQACTPMESGRALAMGGVSKKR